MTEIKLTEDQIQSLFAFVKSKYVRYIDVKYELVDHLASAIEDEMQKDAKLSFDAALSKVYARFPVTGFTNFIASKARSLGRYWQRRYFKVMLTYFTPPKILLTILIYIFCFQTTYFYGKNGLMVLVILSMITNLFFYYRLYRTIQFIKGKQKDYLFFQSFGGIAGSLLHIQYACIILLKDFSIDDSSSTLSKVCILILAFICTSSLITAHANYSIFPKILYDEINAKYKHLGIVVR